METIGCLLPNTLVRLGPKRIGWSFVPPPIYCQQSCICVFLKNASSIQRSNPYNYQHSGLPLGMVNRGLHFAKRASCIHIHHSCLSYTFIYSALKNRHFTGWLDWYHLYIFGSLKTSGSVSFGCIVILIVVHYYIYFLHCSCVIFIY